MIRDIVPKSSINTLKRDYTKKELRMEFDADLVSAVVGMSRAFLARALGRPGSRPSRFTLSQVMKFLDIDGFQETFIPRSRIPSFLMDGSSTPTREMPGLRRSVWQVGSTQLIVTDARDELPKLEPGSVQCVATSSPYWGMRVYDNVRNVRWADGESCPYGFEQTPEGFIRHTIELLWLMKPALAVDGSIWWNVMDTYNTRTPIRGNARERLDAMGEMSGSRMGWTQHSACRHSAGHMYLDDTELSSIPARIAERASRIGYKFKSFITWRKHTSMPEAAKNRVSRQAEYVLHLSVSRTPLFDRSGWQTLDPKLGGPNSLHESAERITDVWCLPTSTGKNGHGAEFPLALAGRCIALSSHHGDLVLDPFVGSGTTALAAEELGRRCVGYDISEQYVNVAKQRLEAAARRIQVNSDTSGARNSGEVAVEPRARGPKKGRTGSSYAASPRSPDGPRNGATMRRADVISPEASRISATGAS
jgi:DNA modification methylase